MSAISREKRDMVNLTAFNPLDLAGDLVEWGFGHWKVIFIGKFQ
ncbi:MAG: hypothetical protein ACJAVI_001310 [Candidatus Azotimanducaceae bacterium]|jgi:hypothetical protein